MRIEDVLLEGISPIVYHFTNLRNLYDILHNNMIELSPGSFTKDVEAEKGKGGYYLSTTRTRTGSFHVNQSFGALIKLDGKKLSQNLSGKAVDYYPTSMRDYNPKGFEQEDRIFSNKPQIDNAQKYILGIDILLSSSDIAATDSLKKKYKQLAYTAYSYGKKNNINIRIYDNKKDFIAGSSNTVSFEDIKKMNTGDKSATKDIRRQSTDKDIQDLAFIYKALKFEDFNKFSKEEQRFLKDYLRYFEGEKNNPAGLISTLHNVTPSKNARRLLQGIYEQMRKYGIKNITPSKITKAIYIKWKQLLGAV